MTFKYANLARSFVESCSIGEVFITRKLSVFLSRKLKRKISLQKAARLLDGCEDCIPVGEDKKRRRQWKRVL